MCKLKPTSITIKKNNRGIVNKPTVEIECNHNNTLLIQKKARRKTKKEQIKNK